MTDPDRDVKGCDKLYLGLLLTSGKIGLPHSSTIYVYISNANSMKIRLHLYISMYTSRFECLTILNADASDTNGQQHQYETSQLTV